MSFEVPIWIAITVIVMHFVNRRNNRWHRRGHLQWREIALANSEKRDEAADKVKLLDRDKVAMANIIINQNKEMSLLKKAIEAYQHRHEEEENARVSAGAKQDV